MPRGSRIKSTHTRSSEKQQRLKSRKTPVPTIDLILRRGRPNEILLEKRGASPCKGLYALPGGHVDYGETVENAALRELKEETSLQARLVSILGVYSDPKRDPRGQRITTVFIADCVNRTTPKAGDDAAYAEWVEIDNVITEPLAFDHRKIILDYLRCIKEAKCETFWSSKTRSVT